MKCLRGSHVSQRSRGQRLSDAGFLRQITWSSVHSLGDFIFSARLCFPGKSRHIKCGFSFRLGGSCRGHSCPSFYERWCLNCWTTCPKLQTVYGVVVRWSHFWIRFFGHLLWELFVDQVKSVKFGSEWSPNFCTSRAKCLVMKCWDWKGHMCVGELVGGACRPGLWGINSFNSQYYDHEVGSKNNLWNKCLSQIDWLWKTVTGCSLLPHTSRFSFREEPNRGFVT